MLADVYATDHYLLKVQQVKLIQNFQQVNFNIKITLFSRYVINSVMCKKK